MVMKQHIIRESNSTPKVILWVRLRNEINRKDMWTKEWVEEVFGVVWDCVQRPLCSGIYSSKVFSVFFSWIHHHKIMFWIIFPLEKKHTMALPTPILNMSLVSGLYLLLFYILYLCTSPHCVLVMIQSHVTVHPLLPSTQVSWNIIVIAMCATWTLPLTF